MGHQAGWQTYSSWLCLLSLLLLLLLLLLGRLLLLPSTAVRQTCPCLVELTAVLKQLRL
jgi:hypothetical protein